MPNDLILAQKYEILREFRLGVVVQDKLPEERDIWNGTWSINRDDWITKFERILESREQVLTKTQKQEKWIVQGNPTKGVNWV